MSRLFQNFEQSEAGVTSAHLAHTVLSQLDHLLSQSDTAAMALFQQHTTLLAAVLGDDFNTLVTQLQRFAFDQARITLNKNAHNSA